MRRCAPRRDLAALGRSRLDVHHERLHGDGHRQHARLPPQHDGHLGPRDQVDELRHSPTTITTGCVTLLDDTDSIIASVTPPTVAVEAEEAAEAAEPEVIGTKAEEE